MVIACGYDAQNDVSLITRRTRHVAQRLFAAQPDGQHFTRTHALQPELGANERHRTNLAGDVDGLVWSLVWNFENGVGHGFNYTPRASRCRLHSDA